MDLHNFSDLLHKYQRPLACKSLLQLGGCTESAVDNHVDVDFGIPKISRLVDANSKQIESGCVVSEVPNHNLFAIHDRKDGNRLGYYFCMHCMA